QLAYPWLRTGGSDLMPERLEAPEGVLAGMLARNALVRGTFHSAVPLYLPDVYDFDPHLPNMNGDDVLEDHVSRCGGTPPGLGRLSDVTTSADVNYRQAGVSRLVAAILRAARNLGEDRLFEPSNERLWADMTAAMSDLLGDLWRAGALRGAEETDAFTVRCDR